MAKPTAVPYLLRKPSRYQEKKVRIINPLTNRIIDVFCMIHVEKTGRVHVHPDFVRFNCEVTADDGFVEWEITYPSDETIAAVVKGIELLLNSVRA